MAFNTRRYDEEPIFDPNNPYGEPQPQPAPLLPWSKDKGFNEPWPQPQPQPMPAQPSMGGPQPMPQYMPQQPPMVGPQTMPEGMQKIGTPAPLPPPQRPNRPIPRPGPTPDNIQPYIKAMDPASTVREGEVDPRLLQKIRSESPYNNENFYKKGGLGDQMRGKAYDDNDNMMDDVLMMEQMRKRPKQSPVDPGWAIDRRNDIDIDRGWGRSGPTMDIKRPDKGVTREIPKSWYDEDNGFEPIPRGGKNSVWDDMIDPGWSPRYRNRNNPALELQEAKKKGINPVPWSRRNRALE